MIPKTLFFATIFLGLCGCINDLTPEDSPEPVKPVIMAIFMPQRNISVGVYKSRPFFSTDKDPYLKARVELWRNDHFVTLALPDSALQYSADVFPLPNEKWTVKVFSAVGDAWASTIIPSKIPLKSAVYYEKYNFIKENGWDYKTRFETEVTFDDPATKDYYCIEAALVTSRYPRWGIGLISDDPIIIKSGSLRATDLLAYYDNNINDFYLFADDVFTTRTQRIRAGFNVEDQYPPLTFPFSGIFRASLYHCNSDFYEFYKSARQNNLPAKPDFLPLFFGDVSNNYSNVQGGLGIVAAYTVQEMLATPQ
jgi:Domain of unknown function (DUF4249)